MLKSLRGKLLLWNALFFLLALLAFGSLQLWLSHRSAESILDRMLIARAMDVAQGPGPRQGQGQGPGQGREPNGPPDGPGNGEGPNGPQPRPQFRDDDLRRPRMIGLDGKVIMPRGQTLIWSKELYARSLRGEVSTGFGTINGTPVRIASVPGFNAERKVRNVVQVAQETETLDVARSGQLWALLAGLPVALIASLGIAFLLSRLVLKPVGDLTRTAEGIAADPSSKERIPVASQDEMGRLSATFNRMTDSLQDSNEQLEASLERQKRFTSDAAHELRTPLTSIALAAENGLHQQATPDEMKRSLTIVNRSATSMKKLTEVLLALSRLDTGNQDLAMSEFELLPVLKESASLAEVEEDPRLDWEVPDGTIVHANADAVRQIVRNLLENAAVYTPEAGHIKVSWNHDTLSVQDSGIGIAKEHLSHLFERFYRADASRTRGQGGHGLGLSIAQGLAQAQGFELKVSSEVGRGTTFFINFMKNPLSS